MLITLPGLRIRRIFGIEATNYPLQPLPLGHALKRSQALILEICNGARRS